MYGIEECPKDTRTEKYSIFMLRTSCSHVHLKKLLHEGPKLAVHSPPVLSSAFQSTEITSQPSAGDSEIPSAVELGVLHRHTGVLCSTVRAERHQRLLRSDDGLAGSYEDWRCNSRVSITLIPHKHKNCIKESLIFCFHKYDANAK